MAKEIESNIINSPDDLVTSREKTRTGFISMALEKNYLATPYIDEAKALKALSTKIKHPKDILNISGLRRGLLTASGLSDKALNYLTEEDKTEAIRELITNFLEPAGENFVDEIVYRFLLTKGDALGGKSRNLAGALGERKFLRSLLSVLNIAGIEYLWKDCDSNTWNKKLDDESGIEKRIKAIYWNRNGLNRLLLLNTSIPVVGKNVDLSVLNGTVEEVQKGVDTIIHNNEKFIALGELKGGIDPAGADEHWKTAKSALIRIRESFGLRGLKPKTFFIGAAIERSMALEMFEELQIGVLNSIANLTIDEQLISLCEWLISI